MGKDAENDDDCMRACLAAVAQGDLISFGEAGGGNPVFGNCIK
jgi:hypothetical protein